MFTQFSEKLYRLCAAREYRAASPGAELRMLADTPCWVVQKAENASLCIVHVIDCDRYPLQAKEDHAAYLRGLDSFLDDFRSVMVLFVLVSENETPSGAETGANLREWQENAEEYCGQPVYAVYWRVQLKSQCVSILKGQPGELFGLRSLVEKALVGATGVSGADETANTAIGSENGTPRTFREVSQSVLEESPYKPKHSHAVLTWVLIVVNAMVMMLMYMDGYASDPLTAARFGAIVPELVFQKGEYYRLFTAMFVHFGYTHLLMNTTGLMIFGARVERYYGRGLFLLLYICTGLCGSVFSLFLTRGYAAGASGAIYGLVGAVFAYTRVAKRSMDKLTGYIMLLYIGIGLGMGFATPNIDNFGHIGGLVAGFTLGVVVLKRNMVHSGSTRP